MKRLALLLCLLLSGCSGTWEWRGATLYRVRPERPTGCYNVAPVTSYRIEDMEMAERVAREFYIQRCGVGSRGYSFDEWSALPDSVRLPLIEHARRVMEGKSRWSEERKEWL